jgi:hypothetical protein
MMVEQDACQMDHEMNRHNSFEGSHFHDLSARKVALSINVG